MASPYTATFQVTAGAGEHVAVVGSDPDLPLDDDTVGDETNPAIQLGVLHVNGAELSAANPLPISLVGGIPGGTAGDVVMMLDFRPVPDGGLPSTSNGPGTADPADVYDISAFVPLYASPTAVEDGVARAPVGGDPARSGLSILAPIPATGRIHYEHGGYLDPDGSGLEDGDEIHGNLAIADNSGNGYILHTVIVGDGGGEVHAELHINRDDAAVATALATVALDAIPVAGDIISFGWEAGVYTGYLNGVATIAADDDTYDPSTFAGVGVPFWQDFEVYRHGVRWVALTSKRVFDPGYEAPSITAYNRLVTRIVALEP